MLLLYFYFDTQHSAEFQPQLSKLICQRESRGYTYMLEIVTQYVCFVLKCYNNFFVKLKEAAKEEKIKTEKASKRKISREASRRKSLSVLANQALF